MDYQQPHGYMRHPPPPPPPPPPPSAADPFQRPPVPPPPSNHPWPYSATQFHYQPQPQTQHSPSPPPPQWQPPPPHSSDHVQYPPNPPPYQTHQPPPYPGHPHYPLPPRPPHVPQSYSQDWGSGSWSHHQSWQYPIAAAANNQEEDWAARAKAWAAAKSASDNQHTLSQFVPAGRQEEQNHFHGQYPQSMDPQFLDGHTSSTPASNYHQFPVAMGQLNRTGVGQFQESQYMSSGQSSYAADVHASFAARDGGVAGDSIQPFLPQEKSPISPLVHQQEVPSSYSSVTGNVEAGDRYEKLNSSSSTPAASLPPHHIQHMVPTTGRSGWVEEPHHVLGSHPAESVTDMSDQPLNFAPHFNRDPDTHVQPNYAHSSGVSIRGGDPTVAMSSNYAWPPSTAPGPAYPPVPPTMPLGPQGDHPMAMPSPVSGHTAPIFPPGPGFQPTLPMIGSAFGVGAGVTPHPTTFLADAYGASERPKKASVPNWLREEIIKNKAVITSSSSAPNFPKEDSQSMEDDNNDKSSRKGDQSDSKSMDSSGSTEDEDEDEVEVARAAAINLEIKRVLTEVLLKVTDELFDEIATKVMKEDDLSVEVGRNSDLTNPHILPSAPSIATPKAYAKVLIPTKTNGIDNEDASEKSTSGSPGDILGLANYASDEEDEIQSSGKTKSKERSMQHQSSSSKLLEGDPVIENGDSREEKEEQRNLQAKLGASSNGRKSPGSVANLESDDNMDTKEFTSADSQHSSKRLSGIVENELQHSYDTSNLSNSLTEKAVESNEIPDGNFEAKRWMNNDSWIQNARNGSDKNDELENKRSSMKKEHKDSESSKGRLDKKGDEEYRRHEERRTRSYRNDYNDNSKDKAKEKGKTDEKAKNTESRKRSSPDDKEGTTETHKDKRSSSKKDNDERRKERTGDERKERSRHKSGVESSRHKRRRSSSVGAGDKESKDNSVVSRANDSSDESSDDSKRKSHHSRRRKSPLPTRSRKRQVSRSPHSKHSKRRHSPYSSLESTRSAFYEFPRVFLAIIFTNIVSGEDCDAVTCFWLPKPIINILVAFSPLFKSILKRSKGVRARRSNQLVDRTIHFVVGGENQRGEMKSRYSLFLSNIYNTKILQSGLWLVWMCGFFLIGVSFYGTQMLKEQIKIKKPAVFGVAFDDLSIPSISIFTAPRPFVGSIGERQAVAVRSWLGLSENINVVLFSQDPSVFSFADSIGSRISVETKIDFTFLGTPFFHSMVARSLSSSSDISVFVDPDTIILADFLSTLKYVHKLDEDWLLVASSQNVSNFPFSLDSDGKSWLVDDGKHAGIQKLQAFLVQDFSSRSCGEKMLIAWNNGDLPLHKGVLPPFLFGKGTHNHWLITEALISDFRLVIDASLSVSSFYVNDPNQENYVTIRGSISDFKTGSWELTGNSIHGRNYGSFSFRDPNYTNSFRLSVCGRNYLFINTYHNIAYWLGMGYKRIFLPKQKEILDCVEVIKSIEGIERCFTREPLSPPNIISLSMSIESLLSMQADQNKTILLGIAGSSYKDMLMSWVCRLRYLQLQNFLVCALDDDIYVFSVLQGLPVTKCTYPPTNVSFDNCHFGTECFQKVTKVKSRMVLQILKLGYNVLLSDVDVYWFKNPLNYLTSFGPAVLVAQSDEYNLTGPINLPRRLNSGFYYAHSDSTTITAMEKVVKHAAYSNLSEQPSFYDTLCGEGGSYRLGDNQCLDRETNLLVHFLDRDLFPNGAYRGLWEEKDIKTACRERGCFILHNNWISGRKKKLERQVLSGLWEYDINSRMCVQSCPVVHNTCKRQQELKEENFSYSVSRQLKDIMVRIVHSGGRIEMYQTPIPASELIQKYPGLCITTPHVFKRPFESVLSDGDILLPGRKYFLMRCTAVEKLKHRHSMRGRASDEPFLKSEEIEDVGDICFEESICSARDFFVPTEYRSNFALKKPAKEKRPFVPPIQRPKLWKEHDWEPSLDSIQELSP
ncbi:Nucleotide-diphospho-sugar transferase family protein [Perilla frutescens var. hirtella]|uniref:Nucleotide-diphospho-sugar transferase family protein n=1 Tax=Perilla frutescens var. hirtella TaxID=608512 RepID=A0AAD4J6D1_PERFH|nr:Nucleotide-diphospho-sugar transferase family protein [Perilla frutescens var. hirtella]